MRYLVALISFLAILTAPVSFSGCGDGEGDTIYCCAYESRYTNCGGVGWNEWESSTDQFDIDDYLDDWSPQRVCDKYTGSDLECGGSCCINVEYRNNTLSPGVCDGG